MYRNVSIETANMEYLWNITNPYVGDKDNQNNSDPAANSLFNITTLKTIVALGQKTEDIVGADKHKVYGKDFNLTEDWDELATTLDLNEDNDKEMGKKRAYMLWLWMKTAKNLTFER